MPTQKKQNQLTSLVDLIKSTQNFTLIKHEKTTHIALEGLRKELRANDASMKVVKNSLLEKAVHKLSDSNSTLKTFTEKAFPIRDTSAFISLGSDWSKGISAIHKFSQKDQTVSFKTGVLDNSVYGSEELVKIAKLPSKPELVAKLLGNMKGPTSHFAVALKYNMQKFVYVLSERSKQTA